MWIFRFIKLCRTRHTLHIQPEEIERYLNHLAVNRNVPASTQNQALCSILFLYNRVLWKPIPQLNSIQGAKKPKKMVRGVCTEHLR